MEETALRVRHDFAVDQGHCLRHMIHFLRLWQKITA